MPVKSSKPKVLVTPAVTQLQLKALRARLNDIPIYGTSLKPVDPAQIKLARRVVAKYDKMLQDRRARRVEQLRVLRQKVYNVILFDGVEASLKAIDAFEKEASKKK